MTAACPVIVVFNSKGGVGKTTIAWSLAVWWNRQDKHVMLVDTDPQGTLIELFKSREDKGNMESTCVALPGLKSRIQREVQSGHHDIIIIDTPGRLSELAPAIEVADVIIFPVQPSGIDILAFNKAYRYVDKKKTLIVPSRTKTAGETETLQKMIAGLTAGEAVIGPAIVDRIGHRRDTINGLSIIDTVNESDKGYQEIAALAAKLGEMINV